MTIIIFIIILSLLVFVHEGGHFMAARWAGMKVHEFALGFPPRAFGWYWDPQAKRYRFLLGRGKDGLKNTIAGDETKDEYPSTVYTINWLPLGGFVKIKGENGEYSNDTDSFGSKPAWKRVIVLCAGVVMNFLLAAVLLGGGFMIGLPSDAGAAQDKHAIVVQAPSVLVESVRENTPAEEAGLASGDTVLLVDGEKPVSAEALRTYIGEQGTTPITFVVARGSEEKTITMTPKAIEGYDETPRIGALLGDAAVIRYPWYIAIVKGFQAAGFGVVNIVISFGYLLYNLIIGQGLAFDVAGPVGIASMVGTSARLGLAYLINVTAMISLSLAVMNILPIPALDGGRVLFVIIEKVLRKPVPMKYEQIAHTIGFILLMAMVVVVTWRDIVKLF